MHLIENIFYTKNLTSLIQKYKSFEGFNKNALIRMNRKILLQLVLGAALIFLIAYVPQGYVSMIDLYGYGHLIMLASFIVLLVAVRWHVYFETELYIIPYTEGFISNGVIECIKYRRPAPSSTRKWQFTCSYKNISGELERKPFQAMEYQAFSSDVKAGDAIKIAINPNRPMYKYPYLEYYFSYYCLNLEKKD